MTNFKPGDRVQYNAKVLGATREHMELGTVVAAEGDTNPYIRWDDGSEDFHVVDYLVLVAAPTTDFKPGDHVYYAEIAGVIEAINSLGDHKVRFEHGAIGYYSKGELEPMAQWEVELLGTANTRPLVGPAPKVEAPKYIAPFKSEFLAVYDDTGRRVLTVTGTGGDTDETEFAAYVAAALNARVFGEE